MKLSISGFMFWFFALLLTASIKLGLDKYFSINSSDLWGSLLTSAVAFIIGFGVVGFFRKHVMKPVIVGGAK